MLNKICPSVYRRYQDTVRLLKDYYRGMEGQIPEEITEDYARVPLVEPAIVEPTVAPSVASGANAEPGGALGNESSMGAKSVISGEGGSGDGGAGGGVPPSVTPSGKSVATTQRTKTAGIAEADRYIWKFVF